MNTNVNEEGRYAELSAKLNNLFAELKATTDEAVALGFASDGLIHEAAAEHKLSGEVLAAILMQYFDWETPGNTVTKQFLLDLVEELGPDHLENLRKSVAFMQKVSSF